MMIELKGRGFALLATVLSFIADDRDTQESIECNIDQGLISSYQQRFGTLETLRADVLVRRLTYGGLECSRKWNRLRARNRCQVIDRKIAFQVSL